MIERHFRLEAVLGLRERARREAEEILGKALSRRSAVAGKYGEALKELAACGEGLCRNTFTVLERQQGWKNLLFRRQACERWKEQLAVEDESVRKCREALKIAARDHELVFKLREKWQRHLDYEIARAEERALEDFVNGNRSFRGVAA